jgi:outer membrane protein assembly factor BamB
MDDSTSDARAAVAALDVIDAATGRKPWTHRLDGPIGDSPAVVDGGVYVATNVGSLVALTR